MRHQSCIRTVRQYYLVHLRIRYWKVIMRQPIIRIPDLSHDNISWERIFR